MDAKGKFQEEVWTSLVYSCAIKSMVPLNIRVIGMMNFTWTLSSFLRALDFYLLKKKVK